MTQYFKKFYYVIVYQILFQYTGAHWAVKTNNLHILKMLIHGGIDLNATSHNGGTLLHLGTVLRLDSPPGSTIFA